MLMYKLHYITFITKPSRHGPLLPDSNREILVGPSGSGKTNVMFNLITNRN
jgi:serine kinase of HPr protein (carbohydrate metabolism regulator)